MSMNPPIPRNSSTLCRNPAAGEPGSLRQEFTALAIVLSDPSRFINGDRAHRRARAISQGRRPFDGRCN